MFDACYLRLGQGRFASCTPLTVSLVSSLYALPACDEPQLRAAVDASGAGQPWADSLAVAPDQTIAAIGAMLRQVMLATRDLEPARIDTSGLPEGSRARLHLEALRDLWTAHPEIVPADLQSLKHFLACDPSDVLQPFSLIWSRNNPTLRPLEIVVLEKLERASGNVGEDDPDVVRLISARAAAAAPPTMLAGHIQRNLLEPAVSRLAADDSLAVLSVRDSLTECEAAIAIIQRWLAEDDNAGAKRYRDHDPERGRLCRLSGRGPGVIGPSRVWSSISRRASQHRRRSSAAFRTVPPQAGPGDGLGIALLFTCDELAGNGWEPTGTAGHGRRFRTDDRRYAR